MFPQCLKIAKVVPIFKSGDKNTLTNFRTISLLTTLEKLVHIKAIRFLEKQSVLTPKQFGFRTNFSTTLAIVDVITFCFNNIEKKPYSGLVILDLAKAYDAVNYILLKKLKHYGIRDIACQFFKPCLTNRSQIVLINKWQSLMESINMGVP